MCIGNEINVIYGRYKVCLRPPSNPPTSSLSQNDWINDAGTLLTGPKCTHFVFILLFVICGPIHATCWLWPQMKNSKVWLVCIRYLEIPVIDFVIDYLEMCWLFVFIVYIMGRGSCAVSEIVLYLYTFTYLKGSFAWNRMKCWSVRKVFRYKRQSKWNGKCKHIT